MNNLDGVEPARTGSGATIVELRAPGSGSGPRIEVDPALEQGLRRAHYLQRGADDSDVTFPSLLLALSIGDDNVATWLRQRLEAAQALPALIRMAKAESPIYAAAMQVQRRHSRFRRPSQRLPLGRSSWVRAGPCPAGSSKQRMCWSPCSEHPTFTQTISARWASTAPNGWRSFRGCSPAGPTPPAAVPPSRHPQRQQDHLRPRLNTIRSPTRDVWKATSPRSCGSPTPWPLPNPWRRCTS